MILRSLFLLLLFSMPIQAEQLMRSPPERATLLELYTSEGCSSCPPADRWFTTLVDHPALWQSLVPVAFHVDYWNYLGWEDRFAAPTYGERQRQYKREGSTNGVYTPGVVAAGREWRSWRQAPQQIPTGSEKVGVLELRDSGDHFSASFEPANPEAGSSLQLHLAVLGFGLATPVRAGENRGRDLRHDFVVLSHEVFAEGALHWTGQVPVSPLADQAGRLALVAWVSSGERLSPLQAVGGWRAGGVP